VQFVIVNQRKREKMTNTKCKPMPPLPNAPREPAPCSDLVRLGEKVNALEQWRVTTESDLKDIRDTISQVKLLMSLSIGGVGLSLLTIIVTLVNLVAR
jgi:hypothetical protein